MFRGFIAFWGEAQLAKTQAMQKALALGVRVKPQRSYFQAQSAWQSIQVAQTAVEQAREGLPAIKSRDDARE